MFKHCFGFLNHTLIPGVFVEAVEIQVSTSTGFNVYSLGLVYHAEGSWLLPSHTSFSASYLSPSLKIIASWLLISSQWSSFVDNFSSHFTLSYKPDLFHSLEPFYFFCLPSPALCHHSFWPDPGGATAHLSSHRISHRMGQVGTHSGSQCSSRPVLGHTAQDCIQMVLSISSQGESSPSLGNLF